MEDNVHFMLANSFQFQFYATVMYQVMYQVDKKPGGEAQGPASRAGEIGPAMISRYIRQN